MPVFTGHGARGFKETKVRKMRAVSSGKCEPFCSGDAARTDGDIAAAE